MTPETGISSTPVRSVRKDLARRVYPAGATIFAEGEVGTIAYILLRGDVTIFTSFGTVHQRIVTELKPGQMFGVRALMAGAQRAASAKTTHGCELLAVSECQSARKIDPRSASKIDPPFGLHDG